jgi:Cys-tRNA(Pro)/Cys-tRNA(Cys) deacylase
VSEVDVLGPLDIHQHLLAHDVRHEIVRVRRAAPTAAQLPESLAVSPGRCVLAYLFVMTDIAEVKPDAEQLVLVLAPADVDMADDRLRRAIESNLSAGGAATQGRLLRRVRRPVRMTAGAITISPAGPELVSRRTDYLASHLAPMLLPADIAVVAVSELAALGTDIVYTATGDGGTALALRACDLVDITNARRLEPVGDPSVIVLDTPTDVPASKKHGVAFPTARPGDPVVLPVRDRVPEGTT